MSTESACPLKPSDFASNQEVRWCPGCGDYAILAGIKKTLAKLHSDKSKVCVVSGIGCSSRFPYYVSTFGFHSIHGRAATIGTGLKLARPDLSVWIITGDGDALAIGGNHFIHLIRRNVNVKIILFNNRIYGLTKGQYSPTTLKGQKTKSSPMGVPEDPIRPISVAIGAEATFAARVLDSDVHLMEEVLEQAALHQGTAFVEVYQNCVIFNDGTYNYIADKNRRADAMLTLAHGQPMLFGKNHEKGIRLHGLKPEIVNVADVDPATLLKHDAHCADPSLAFLLSRMRYPEFPEPMGVFRDVSTPTYDGVVRQQMADARQSLGVGDLQTLLLGREHWKVA